MKILHTADWHAGRTLHGFDRTPEIRSALREVADLAQSEQVDLILVAGDLFDTRNPGAAAEEAVFEFFLTTGRAGIPSVVIAGNHDSPQRLEALREVLKLTQTHIFGEVRVAGQGGVLELATPSGELARIAALPFASERRLVKVADLLTDDPGAWRGVYQARMRTLINNLTQGFGGDAVNLLMLHTTMEGATLSHSEYSFHCTEHYTLAADLLPLSCDYVALGHIHKAQPVKDFATSAGRYVGSLVQLDFGEEGESKTVDIVRATPGKPTELLMRHEIYSGKRLKSARLDLDALERRTPDLAGWGGHLKVVVKLDRPVPGLKDRIRAHLPNVLAVELELPERPDQKPIGVDLKTTDLTDAYALYYRDHKGKPLPDTLRNAFAELYTLTHDESAGDKVGEAA